jgi:hypothetical protein
MANPTSPVQALSVLPIYIRDYTTRTLYIHCTTAKQLKAAMQVSAERGLTASWSCTPNGTLLVTVRDDHPLSPGTPVRLPDGTVAYATPDRRVGSQWNGEYRVRQGDRVDLGWRRWQLETIGGGS